MGALAVPSRMEGSDAFFLVASLVLLAIILVGLVVSFA
jgi:hypothetical protein